MKNHKTNTYQDILTELTKIRCYCEEGEGNLALIDECALKAGHMVMYLENNKYQT